MNKIINGHQIAQAVLENLKKDIVEKIGFNKIALAFVLVGKDPASQTYVKMKKKACHTVGIHSLDYELPETTTEKELLTLVNKLSQDEQVHGILIQQPFPKHIDTKKVVYAMNPAKDVDGFHPLNVGKMLLGDPNAFISCTPLGIKTLMEKAGITVEKKHVVIVGRSNIVGKPLAALLMQNQKGCNAIVTVIHSKTSDLSFYTKQADILIAAVGVPNLITKDMVKPGAIVIDVGINRVFDNKIVGDVDFEAVFPIVSKITPVPKGVGPMTIASLLTNTYKSYVDRIKSS